MSWYDKDWDYREAIAVDNTSGSATIDISATLPTDWSMWDNVQSDGDDIRVCDADGRTLLTYQLVSWNSTTRTGSVEIDNYAAPTTDGIPLVWIYWGNAAAADAAGSFTADSAKTGVIDPICQPRRNVFRVRPQDPGRTKPRSVVTKGSGETIHVYLDVSDLLTRRCAKVEDSLRGEEVDFVSLQVLSGVSDQTSMYAESNIRIYHPALIRLQISGGSSGTDYTISATVATTEGRVLNPRILLKVKDVSE